MSAGYPQQSIFEVCRGHIGQLSVYQARDLKRLGIE